MLSRSTARGAGAARSWRAAALLSVTAALVVLLVLTATRPLTARAAGRAASPASSAPALRAAAARGAPPGAPADGWRLAVTRHYGPASDASGYSAVVTPGGSDVWVFGGTNPGGASTPVVLRLTGERWRSSALPAGLTGFVSDASAPSARDVWAVSYGGGYVLHWDGRNWSVARRWRHAGAATGVVALSPSDVWVFGTMQAGRQGLGTWHLSGRSWTRVGGLAGQIYRASAVSARDIWAVAATSRSGFVEHFDGRSWRRVSVGPALAGASLDDVLALSARDVWVVGNEPARRGEGRLVVAHFDGRRWAATRTPWHADTGRLAADGAGGVWISADNAADAVIGHLSRRHVLTGAVVRHGLGSGISDIAASAAGGAWLSGGFLTRAGGDAAVWSRPARPSAAAGVSWRSVTGGVLLGRRGRFPG